jgi:hypothetical protein
LAPWNTSSWKASPPHNKLKEQVDHHWPDGHPFRRTARLPPTGPLGCHPTRPPPWSPSGPTPTGLLGHCPARLIPTGWPGPCTPYGPTAHEASVPPPSLASTLLVCQDTACPPAHQHTISHQSQDSSTTRRQL